MWDRGAQVAVKRSTKTMANCALAAVLSLAGILPLLGDKVQDKKQYFEDGLVGREMAVCPHGGSQLGIQGLDGVRNRYVDRGAGLVRLGWL